MSGMRLAHDELRRMLRRPAMTDEQAGALQDDLYLFLDRALDACFAQARRETRGE